MRGRVVEIEVVFLHILAMVAFVAREIEEPFFQNRVVLVPECEAKQINCLRSPIPANPSSFQR